MNTYLWHDYETWGINPRRDRPAQFAAIRTDMDLNELGQPLMLYCQPPPDALPPTPAHRGKHAEPGLRLRQRHAVQMRADRRNPMRIGAFQAKLHPQRNILRGPARPVCDGQGKAAVQGAILKAGGTGGGAALDGISSDIVLLDVKMRTEIVTYALNHIHHHHASIKRMYFLLIIMFHF